MIKFRRMKWVRHVRGRGEVHTYWRGNMRERVRFKDLGKDGMIILKWIFKKGMGDMDWIDLVQDWDR